MEQERSAKKRIDKKLLVLPAAAIVAAGAVLGLLFLFNGDGEEHTVYDADAFFVREKSSTDSSYALFDKNGNKKTDFIFKSNSAFVNGHALVRNNENQYGIINQDGHMTVDFGKYPDIETRGGLYETNKDNVRTIIKGDGGEIAKDYVSASEAYGAPYALVEVETHKYKLYNATGGEVLSFESESRPTFATYDKKLATSLSYDNHLVLLNNKKLNVITKQDTGNAYSLSSVSSDLKTFALKARKDKGYTWAVYNDGKFKEYGDDCNTVSLVDSTKTISDRKYLTCRRNDGSYLIRGTDVSNVDVNESNNRAVVFDSKHYARFNSRENKLKLYVDDNEKLSVDCDATPTIRGKGYFVIDSKHKHSALYDLDGKQLFELSSATHAGIYGPDENERIIVQDPSSSENEHYYLINKDGKTITKKYKSISRLGKYYSAVNSDGKSADLLDHDGNVVISGGYQAYKAYRNGKLFFGQIAENKYDLIDAKGKSVKLSLEGKLSVNKDGYFTIASDNETVFYTLKGKDFYHQNK